MDKINPVLKPVPIPEHEVVRILKNYILGMPLTDRLRFSSELIRCPCVVCAMIRSKIDPRL